MTANAMLLVSRVPQTGPPPAHFEKISCYYCQATECADFLTAQDDLTGRPGTFTFITCKRCGLRYQNPRLRIEHVKDFYDNEYIAHRKKTDYGPLTRFFNWVMDRHDRQKEKLVLRYVTLGPTSEVLDVGCADGYLLASLGAGRLRTLWILSREAKLGLLAAVMAGFGAIVSEVGASMTVGGNLRGSTRVLFLDGELQQPGQGGAARHRDDLTVAVKANSDPE